MMFENSVERGPDLNSLIVVLSWIAVIVFMILLECRGAFVSPQVAVNTLETQGYSQITITDHHYVAVGLQGCGTEDAAKFDAEAVNPAGRRVALFVCTGMFFKGATIRTNP
jgi:hypothetical protein